MFEHASTVSRELKSTRDGTSPKPRHTYRRVTVSLDYTLGQPYRYMTKQSNSRARFRNFAVSAIEAVYNEYRVISRVMRSFLRLASGGCLPKERVLMLFRKSMPRSATFTEGLPHRLKA